MANEKDNFFLYLFWPGISLFDHHIHKLVRKQEQNCCLSFLFAISQLYNKVAATEFLIPYKPPTLFPIAIPQ